MAATVEATPSPEHQAAVAYSLPARSVLAVLSLCAGVVHLVMVPQHAQQGALEGWAFAIMGWLQVLAAVALIARPSRHLLQAVIVVNLAIIGLWAWSRTTGLPVGAHAGEPEEARTVDQLTTAFEALLVLGSGALLWRPRLGAKLTDATLAVASIVPVLAIVATSFALADPETANHVHADGEAAAGHVHGSGVAHDAQMASIAANRCDLDINPASYWQETTVAGIDNIMGGAHLTDDHSSTTPTPVAIEGSPELDRLIAKTTQPGGEVKDSAVIVALAEVSDEVYTEWLRWLPQYSGSGAHAHGTGGSGDDNHGMGGHLGPQPWIAMTDQAQCDQLKAELEIARQTALRYPTAADAMAAGWVKVTPYLPGIAAHYMNFRYVDDRFEIDKPEMILYDGDGPDASVVGLSYYILHDSEVEPTQGFTGPNDHFHRHVGLCVGARGVIGDSTTTPEECAAMGGRKADGTAGWMNHVWIVPGCESPWGMFSGATPLLDRTMGQRSGTDGGGCAGSGVRDRYDLTPGSQTNTPTTVWGGSEAAAGG
ncbi:hypothetical protein [Rhabdothermincola sediminis]|uniref:hypothetical protein n=1 Tax=Rhabdothermincola sediminis TaxID=2751370 RepID=UPI001AA03BA0|nr:hypothetical protein [Rhabdothermincola sediminis]